MNNPLVSEIIYPFSYNIIDVPLSGKDFTKDFYLDFIHR